MGKKLEGNGLFESSRMMLPEHKEQFVRKQEELGHRRRPVLDDQALEQFALLLLESMERQGEVAVSVFDPLRDDVVEGRVVKIDFSLQRVKMTNDTETVSIRFADIVNVVRV
ncbi:YolD-like family protein [Paenibacillus mesophilus]|uniref:YolD-like family protein n=1 Tax=Paenibacillus mesophilus TaxID=2582849 RepID=UPI00110F5F0A|nr:YolD-like family protein [Paenibacillus mesophilus]TMV43397.1 YolD-like family protein [Paenibacillus mesophilus]